MDEIEREAIRRSASHSGHASQRKLSPDYEKIGLRGEEEFGRIFRQRPDLSARPRGDGGKDFMLDGYKVNLKTSRKAYLGMLVEAGKVDPNTIYVSAQYDEETDTASLDGWQWGSVVLRYRPKDTGRGLINHNVPTRDLRPMSDLFDRATAP